MKFRSLGKKGVGISGALNVGILGASLSDRLEYPDILRKTGSLLIGFFHQFVTKIKFDNNLPKTNHLAIFPTDYLSNYFYFTT